MRRWRVMLGVVIGLICAALVPRVLPSHPREPLAPRAGAVLSECDGRLRKLVIHYVPDPGNEAALVYREFLPRLESDITVYAVCPGREAFDDLLARVGPLACRVEPIIAGHAMTTWARDRWLALSPVQAGGPVTLWAPAGETGADVWPGRAGDQRTPDDIAAALPGKVTAWRGVLAFDGGDFCCDGETVFVAPRLLGRNVQRSVRDRDELLRVLSEGLRRRVVLLEEAPDHHAGMFMMLAGGRTALVGDAGLARRWLEGDSAGAQGAAGDRSADRALCDNLPGGADFGDSTQRLLDAVARQVQAAGYRVVRIPLVPGSDGRTYITYTNAIIDQQGSRRIVYLPQYDGAPGLNALGREAWESLGYEVRPVACGGIFRHGGSLHCLVNVLERG